MAKKKARRFCLFCVAVQLVVLLVLAAKHYLPRDENVIRELDWNQFHQQDEACEWLGEFGAAVAYPGAMMQEALLLRGAAAHWPVLSKVSIPWLLANTTQTDYLGTTIISPNSTFVIFNNNTEMVRQSANPELASKLPARLELTTMREFVNRYEHQVKKPYYYPDGEYYYYQGPVPDELMENLLLTSRPLNCVNQTLAALGTLNNEFGWAKYLQMAGALLRLTDRDTTHIAHYDTQPTLMLQLRGVKDVWIVPRNQLNYTYPYEKGQLLFRRARVNITHPNLQMFPNAKYLRPQKIRLHPGDFLIFPGMMPHQPEAITDSISISFRMKIVKTPSKGKSIAYEAQEYIKAKAKENALVQAHRGHEEAAALADVR